MVSTNQVSFSNHIATISYISSINLSIILMDHIIYHTHSLHHLIIPSSNSGHIYHFFFHQQSIFLLNYYTFHKDEMQQWLNLTFLSQIEINLLQTIQLKSIHTIFRWGQIVLLFVLALGHA